MLRASSVTRRGSVGGRCRGCIAGQAGCLCGRTCGRGERRMSAPLKGLLIGCGFFSRNHLHAWSEVEGAEIAAVCDLDASARPGLCRGVRDCRLAYEFGGSFFRRLRFRRYLHDHGYPRNAGGAGRRGWRSVIVQKPFAPDIETCRRIEANARRAGVPVMLHENFRFQKIFRRLREILDSGEIGAVTFGACRGATTSTSIPTSHTC